MRNWFISLLSTVGLTIGCANGGPVTWSIAGTVVNPPQTAALAAYIGDWSEFRGTLKFDDAAPGHVWCYQWDTCISRFDLRDAVFDAQIDGLHVWGIGAEAIVSPNQDGLNLTGQLSSSNFPLFDFGTWRIGITVGEEGYYSFHHMPWTPVPYSTQDVLFGVEIAFTEGEEERLDQILSVNMFGIWSDVPEPAPLAIYFGLGVIFISMRRLRGSVPSATRRLVAPRP